MAVDRRRALLALAYSSLVLGVPAAGDAAVVDDRMSVDDNSPDRAERVEFPERLDGLDQAVAALTAGYERVSIGTSAVRVRRELAVGLDMLRQGPNNEPVRARLHRCVGRLAALLAATRADLDDSTGAVGAFALAFDHADAAGDRTLQGWIRVWQATLARAADDPRTGSALARDAARLAGRRSPVAARAAVVEGHCEAMLGDRWAVHDRVGLAWRIVGDLTAAEHGEPGFAVDHMHPATLAEMSASVYTDLGWADLASGYVDASIADLDAAGATGLRSLLRVAAGASEVCRGDLERGVAWVNEALDLSADRPSALLTARSMRFVTEARRGVGGQRALDDLAERLRTWSVPIV